MQYASGKDYDPSAWAKQRQERIKRALQVSASTMRTTYVAVMRRTRRLHDILLLCPYRPPFSSEVQQSTSSTGVIYRYVHWVDLRQISPRRSSRLWTVVPARTGTPSFHDMAHFTPTLLRWCRENDSTSGYMLLEITGTAKSATSTCLYRSFPLHSI